MDVPAGASEIAADKVAHISNATLVGGTVVAKVFGLTTDEWTVLGIIAGIIFSGAVSIVSMYCKLSLKRQTEKALETGKVTLDTVAAGD